MTRILIVPDKFKGSLSSHQATEAIAKGWSQVRPLDILDRQPMADGGDGFGEVFGTLLGAQKQITEAFDFSKQPMLSSWWLNSDTQTALCETAEFIGMGLHARGKRHPFQFDTFELGPILRTMAKAGVRKLFIGLGGSATNDGGFGLARSFGWKFYSIDHAEILHWTDLDLLARVEPPQDRTASGEKIPEVEIVVDVTNPLLGTGGATHIFGPQKGLSGHEIAKAEACLTRLARVLETHLGQDLSPLPGAGAAGGLGFGLKAFYGGTFQSGSAVFSELAQIESRIQACDYILTGEGSLDAQSLMGKGVGFIADLATRYNKPCICLAGLNLLEPNSMVWKNFKAYSICPSLASREDAVKNAAELLAKLASLAAEEIPKS